MTPTPEENARKDAFLREMGFHEDEVRKISGIRNRADRRGQSGYKHLYDPKRPGKIIEDHSRLPSADLKDNASRKALATDPFYWREWILLTLGDGGRRHFASSKRSR